jgi:murein hydrolase activator
VTAACLLGCCFLLFARDAKKSIVADFDRKIEEKNVVLDSIRTELQKGREKLGELRKEEGSVVLQIDQVEKNIRIAESFLRAVSRRIDSTSQSIALLQSALSSATAELLSRQQKMKRRLVAIYKAGRLTTPQLILTSRSMSDMLHRVRYFQELNRYDRDLVASIQATKAKIEQDKASLEKEKKRLSAFLRDKKEEHDALVDEQSSHERLLREVRSRKDAYVKMIRDLEAAQKELEKIVAALESRKKKVRTAYEKSLNATFEKQKGALPWPLEGDVVTDFGKVVHSIYKTVTMNTGIDIGSQKGETVYCVASGTVAYIGWMRGLGRLVIVDHGGYYTTYARLDEVLVDKDEKVQPGHSLGLVADGGPIESPRLHFEIRRSTEALNPLDWLEKRKKR